VTGISGISSAMAMYILLDSLGRGRIVEIPSIGATIKAPIYRKRDGYGGVCADCQCTDYLRQWLSEPELWVLLESISPPRLARLGFLIQRRVSADSSASQTLTHEPLTPENLQHLTRKRNTAPVRGISVVSRAGIEPATL
jgi:hypothetical protein